MGHSENFCNGCGGPKNFDGYGRLQKDMIGAVFRYYFTKGTGTANWWRRVDEPPLYSDPVSLTSPALLSHMQQHNIKTAPPLKPDESWGTLRRLMFQLRPGGDFKVPGEALCWSVLLPCVAMKLGKIFTPKYDIKLFYLQ